MKDKTEKETKTATKTLIEIVLKCQSIEKICTTTICSTNSRNRHVLYSICYWTKWIACSINDVFLTTGITVGVYSLLDLQEFVVATLLTVCVAILVVLLLTTTDYRWYNRYTTL